MIRIAYYLFALGVGVLAGLVLRRKIKIIELENGTTVIVNGLTAVSKTHYDEYYDYMWDIELTYSNGHSFHIEAGSKEDAEFCRQALVKAMKGLRG
jgi:hypothetical protein